MVASGIFIYYVEVCKNSTTSVYRK